MKTPIRPLFPYYGSKWRDARRYGRPVPGAPVVEPFAGSAGFSLFHGVADAVLVDADEIVCGVWDFLINARKSEIEALPILGPHDSVDDFAIPKEAKHLVGFWLNRGSATPKKTITRFSSRTDRGQLVWSEKARSRVARDAERVKNWTIIHGDFSCAPDTIATWFIDPPYIDKGRYYRVKFFDFATLAAWSKDRLGPVIVCEQAGADWLPFTPVALTKSTKGYSAEVAWSNGLLLA